MPAPSGVKVSYTEGSSALTISHSMRSSIASSIWVGLDLIPDLIEALKSIQADTENAPKGPSTTKDVYYHD